MITEERLEEIKRRAENAEASGAEACDVAASQADVPDLVLEVRRLRVVLAAIGALDPDGVLGETARKAIGAETNPGRPTH